MAKRIHVAMITIFNLHNEKHSVQSRMEQKAMSPKTKQAS